MAVGKDRTVEIVKKYLKELERNNINITRAIIFGSFANGRSDPDSDIDLAVVSNSFSGDRFEDRRRIVPMRRKIDSRIEPIPFRPADFDNGGILAEEIKRTGIVVLSRD